MMIVVMISMGLFLFTYKSTDFNALGFSFLIFASLCSGIRWSFAQLVMQKSKLGLHNPIDMIYFMQPWMLLSIVPFTIGFEGKCLRRGFQEWQWGKFYFSKQVNAFTKVLRHLTLYLPLI